MCMSHSVFIFETIELDTANTFKKSIAPASNMASLSYELRHFYYNYTDLDSFVERVEFLSELFDKTDEKSKKGFLLTHVCEDTYKVLNNVCQPVKLTDKSYAEIIQLMRSHASQPTTSVFGDRRKFYQEKQKKKELVGDWCERLRRQATKCKFPNGYDEIMRDQFICGLSNFELQKLFFDEDHTQLTLEKAVKKATHYEDRLTEKKAQKK